MFGLFKSKTQKQLDLDDREADIMLKASGKRAAEIRSREAFEAKIAAKHAKIAEYNRIVKNDTPFGRMKERVRKNAGPMLANARMNIIAAKKKGKGYAKTWDSANKAHSDIFSSSNILGDFGGSGKKSSKPINFLGDPFAPEKRAKRRSKPKYEYVRVRRRR